MKEDFYTSRDLNDSTISDECRIEKAKYQLIVNSYALASFYSGSVDGSKDAFSEYFVKRGYTIQVNRLDPIDEIYNTIVSF